MKRMLINTTHSEELRIALVDGQKLYDLYVENINFIKKKSNIYKGKVVRIEPSLEAAFIDYGSKRHGFLPIKEIFNRYTYNKNSNKIRYNIKNILKEGQELIVQIHKEERGEKGALLTTFISLAGSYLVLMPNNPGILGISRKIEGKDRIKLKKLLSLLEVPSEIGIIIRTAGVKQSITSLQSNLNFKLQRWNEIKKKSEVNSAPFLIYQESNIIFRVLRDYLDQDISEIFVDNPIILYFMNQYISLLGRPDFKNKIKLYTGKRSLFNRYRIESQVNSVFQRKVNLPSGGSIIIDTVEALTAIDINSSRSTKGIDIEETALYTNLEAVDEISRQLRLRDLGGLIVIDFIDMTTSKNQKLVASRLRNIVQQDRARIQIGNISKFGLLEMSRQRLNSSLQESKYYICPKCSGKGNINNNESLYLSILNLIKLENLNKNIHTYFNNTPIETIHILLNKKNIMENLSKNVNNI